MMTVAGYKSRVISSCPKHFKRFGDWRLVPNDMNMHMPNDLQGSIFLQWSLCTAKREDPQDSFFLAKNRGNDNRLLASSGNPSCAAAFRSSVFFLRRGVSLSLIEKTGKDNLQRRLCPKSLKVLGASWPDSPRRKKSYCPASFPIIADLFDLAMS